MNDLVKNLKSWCEDQRQIMARSVEMMEQGILRTGERRDNGELKDTTQQSLADNRRSIAELDDLLRQIDEDHPAS
ncbi:hypothetical protein [Methylobacterium gnaphalii]|uniref:Uncharacterized protein n=1 Tax=Methylobacterium gnaphalii TaxID=1010610 RepID=A0A512JIJ6_9HYPH|nr:hypothetical protein [Methylobacterium gnaphalii]GEP09788.1 hypothetical protein MGN01_16330 [Methylobacterium gnaphalii]GJD67297.1 hypothetical protein MMMDOFMJ_0211 [Methylobacterium gnaphalii]GLS49818.1 hypothetical protein GCM10007885_26700 [Methylobacterium gnaphalii]